MDIRIQHTHVIRNWNDKQLLSQLIPGISLQWRHNDHDGVSNHQPHDCLLSSLFRRRSKKTSKLHVTGLCAGNSPITREFPAQRASNAEIVSIWWLHHDQIHLIMSPAKWHSFYTADAFTIRLQNAEYHGKCLPRQWWLIPSLLESPDHQKGVLQWRHNGRDRVSNHQPHDCLLKRLFRRRSKKISNLRVTGLCAGNSPGTGEFPAQMASNAENDSIWWRQHEHLFSLLQWMKHGKY